MLVKLLQHEDNNNFKKINLYTTPLPLIVDCVLVCNNINNHSRLHPSHRMPLKLTPRIMSQLSVMESILPKLTAVGVGGGGSLN